MRIALDTNILAYVEGINGTSRKKAAVEIVEKLPVSSVFIPVQALGELFHVLVRKAGISPKQARAAILSWGDAYALIETSTSVLLAATDLAVDHNLTIWDAIMLSTAAAAGCRLLLSEDLQDGFTWHGVTVANPFAPKKHELLASLL
ncbi:MAG TPA: PIN domain-containing protein [Candidatus Sulfotelmatobacter sp.]|nr:PIN domain-containing protein [Candidatus Sulfotelmatobacter sp.]